MGIEDLNLDLQEHADCMLVITRTDSIRATLQKLCDSRSYKNVTVESIADANTAARDQTIDMIVVDCGNISPDRILSQIRQEARLRRAPVALLSSEFATPRETTDDDPLGPDLLLFPLEFRASDLFLKISSKLRLRKMKRDEARISSELSVQNAQLRDLTTRFKKELKEAQSVQNSLLPKQMPHGDGVRFAAEYIPLEHVGGDLYDLWEISPGVYGLFIGDVTGHGLSAAFIGAMTKMALSYAPKKAADEMLSEMSNGMSPHMPEGRFVTALAAIYNSATRELQIARGGHPPAFLFHKSSNTIEEIAPRGLPLGIGAEVPYQLYQTTLEPGDKLLLVTDGLTETADMNGAMIGQNGTNQCFLRVAPNNSIETCLKEILAYQKDFAGGRIIKDDITLLGLETC